MIRNGKEYRLLGMPDIMEELKKNNLQVEHLVAMKGFAVNLDIERTRATAGLIDMVMTPFCINDNRILRVLSGNIRMEINLTECNLKGGDVLLMREGSYTEILDVSPDVKAEVLVFSSESCHTNLLFSNKRHIIVSPSASENEEIGHLLYTIFMFSRTEPFRDSIVFPLVASLVNAVVLISSNDDKGTETSGQELLYNRFISLLTSNKKGKRPVSDYAAMLCVTPQYLSKVVSTVSGKPATYWINKAIMTEARILLDDPARSVSDVADRLNFPNDSFFCRFFKRESGMTPTQYRRR